MLVVLVRACWLDGAAGPRSGVEETGQREATGTGHISAPQPPVAQRQTYVQPLNEC